MQSLANRRSLPGRQRFSSRLQKGGCRCRVRHLLGIQKDFQAQESALTEVVKGAGHVIELYPKFHCETNWIERYWVAAKRGPQLNCDYTLSALRVNLPVFCDRVSPVDAGSVVCKSLLELYRSLRST